MANIGHRSDLNNFRVTDHGCVKGERLAKEDLHTGSHAGNGCREFSLLYHAIAAQLCRNNFSQGRLHMKGLANKKGNRIRH